VRDFVHNILHDLPLRVTGEDGLKALAITVAAEESYLQAKSIDVAMDGAKAAS
jgi:predicted dehydrogenase